MAEDNQISIEIKLEDGSYRTAIAKLEADSVNAGKSIGGKFASAFDITKILASSVGGLAEFLAPMAAIGAAFKAVGIAEEAEHVESSFAVLTKNAGILGDALVDNLRRSASGLIDNTELLKIANKAIVELGSGAQKLPQYLDLARKATAVFGGSLISNLESINNAIATGNMRELRHLGLIIDHKKAYEDYARSIGVSVNSLTEYGRQQAISNAVLEKGKSVFAGVSGEIGKNSDAWGRLKAAVATNSEALSKAFTSIFGQQINGSLVAASNSLQNFTNSITGVFGHGAEKTAAQMASLNTEIERITKIQLPLAQQMHSNDVELLNMRLAKLRVELALLQNQSKAMEDAKPKGPAAGIADSVEKSFDPVKLAEDRNKFMKVLNEGTSARLQAQMALSVQEEDNDKYYAERKLLIEQEFQEKLNSAKKQAKEAGLEGSKQLAQLEVELEAEKVAKIQALHKKELETQKALTNAFKTGLVNTIVAGFSSIGKSIVNGENVFANFGKAVLGVFGQMAIQMGTVLIAAGLGIEALKSLGGFAAVAAGVALVAIGGLLSALSEGPGASGAPAPGGGLGEGGSLATGNAAGGIGTGGTASSVAQPGTSIAVHINGNVFDSKETGLRIADILRDNFDLHGVTFAGAVTR